MSRSISFCFKLRLKIFAGFLLGIFLLLPKVDVVAQESDITPSQTYSIWININRLLVDYIEFSKINGSQLKELELKEFSEKRPVDVFAKVGEFLELYKTHSDNAVTSHGDDIENLELSILSVITPENGEVIPTMVFLRSLIALDLIAQDYIAHNKGDTYMSQYFEIIDYEAKEPKDVYALVDLGVRRMQILYNYGAHKQ